MWQQLKFSRNSTEELLSCMLFLRDENETFAKGRLDEKRQDDVEGVEHWFAEDENSHSKQLDDTNAKRETLKYVKWCKSAKN